MNLPELIDRCAEITASKGFDVTQHRTQLCLMATEIAEALEHTTPSCNFNTDKFIKALTIRSRGYERYRRVFGSEHDALLDNSTVAQKDELLTELADTVIRICSYVGGNGWRDEFMQALAEKIEKNKERPYKHGKGF